MVRPAWTTLHFVALCCCFFSVLLLPSGVNASWGDQHHIFRNFRRHCLNINCSTDSKLESFRARQPLPLRFLGWDCWSECTYESMWHLTKRTMDEIGKVPQFYGKVTHSSIWTIHNTVQHQEVAPKSPFFQVYHGGKLTFFKMVLG